MYNIHSLPQINIWRVGHSGIRRFSPIQGWILEGNERQNNGLGVISCPVKYIACQDAHRSVLLLGVRVAKYNIIRFAQFHTLLDQFYYFSRQEKCAGPGFSHLVF